MFIFSVARRYLIPKREQLSVSLIALMSVGVISLVTWLLLVFLSVTEGIETGWVKNLTALNAPITISPTDHYFASYYYQSDAISLNSDYRLKTIGEKLDAENSDPFDPDFDSMPFSMPIPHRDSDGTLLNPVKGCFNILETLKNDNSNLAFEEYQISGGLLRLNMLRGGLDQIALTSSSTLTQVAYLATFSEESPSLTQLMLPPESKDLQHIYDSELAHGKDLSTLLNSCEVTAVSTPDYGYILSRDLLPDSGSWEAEAVMSGDHLIRVWVASTTASGMDDRLIKSGNKLSLKRPDGSILDIGKHVELSLEGSLDLSATPEFFSGKLQYNVSGTLQGSPISGSTHAKLLKPTLRSINPKEGFWAYTENGKARLPKNYRNCSPIVLPKQYRKHGTLIGDSGYLSYTGATSSSIQEQRLPVYVSGFYDPGVLSIGNRCLLVPKEIAMAINSSGSGYSVERNKANAIHVWTGDLNAVDATKTEIEKQLHLAGISNYFKVETYRDYDFAKPLFEQFATDKLLFSLVGVIILVVASCNIISLLTLLVSDKKREIGVLLALGASRRSVGAIFGVCGLLLGSLSCIIGTCAAYLTLHNINGIVALIGKIQGHTSFNPAFFGQSLPSELSPSSLLFIAIAGPVIALLSGLIPALKASRACPSEILRSES